MTNVGVLTCFVNGINKKAEMTGIILTPQQHSVYLRLIDFASNGDAALACLQGYAGTGKTTIIARLVHDLASTRNIAVMAPTNKAVGVLQGKIGEVPGVEYGSLHSFLGLRMREREDGTQECTADGSPTLHQYDVAIVDECSMVSVPLFEAILRTKRGCKIIFVGDPAQLAPVGDDTDSPVFRFVPETLHLTEVVRQARDNPIIAASVAVRDAITDGRRVQISDIAAALPPPPTAAGIVSGGMDTIVSILCDEHYAGREARAIAWRRKSVQSINWRVHQCLYPGCTAPFAVDETVIAQSEFRTIPVIGIKIARVYTSEVMTVIDIDQRQHPTQRTPAWRCTLRRDTGCEVAAWLPLDADALQRYISGAWTQYRSLKKDHQHSAAKRLSDALWMMQKAYAPIEHIYAMTAHKSQGSTIDTALIYWDDMAQHRSDHDFNRLVYVAMTRASKYMAIVTS
jgi:exodeoxyribonuclease-5